MSKFMVYIDKSQPSENQEKMRKAIQELYPNNNHYQIDSNLYTIRDLENLSSDISDKLGMNSTGKLIGFIFPISNMNGYYYGNFTEWYQVSQ